MTATGTSLNMPGNIVLIDESPASVDWLQRRFGLLGRSIIPVRTVREMFLHLRDAASPVLAVIVYITMRRQNDLDTVAELGAIRPNLRIILVAPEHLEMHDVLRDQNSRLHVLHQGLGEPGSYDAIAAILSSETTAPAGLGAESGAGGSGATGAGEDNLPYSEDFLRRVGMSDVPVLLHGETGVGKEVMARRLCAYSPRAMKTFLKLNCAALPAELVESELFGYEKGAFTGATVDKPGKFEIAQDGTILLDEIGDMSIHLQAKLLQVLQDGEVQPLGSSRTIQVNVRVLAATHRDLRQAIEQGTFREDLYYRLNVIRIDIPPLRERREEILPLAESLLRRHLGAGAQAPVITNDLARVLLAHAWPGNVRELENVMRRFLVYQDANLLVRELTAGLESARPKLVPKVAEISQAPAGTGSGTAGGLGNLTMDRLAEESRQAESKLLLEALEASRWNRRQAAARLNMDYKAFLYKLQKYGIVGSKSKNEHVGA